MSNKNILIVDDEIETVSTLAEFLKVEGYGTTIVPSVKEAMESFEKGVPDLVFLDMKMDEQDGLVLLSYLNDKYPDTKIIILTGYSSDYEDQVKPFKYEAFISKPYRIMPLLEKINSILK